MPDHIIFELTLIFTVVYTTAALVAIILAWRQVRSSFDISTKEKSLDAYVNFSDKYAELTRMSHDIDVRFHRKDKTLSDYDIKYFFNSFWVLQLEEWEFLQAGILPARIFTQWMMHTHEYLLSAKTKFYFDDKGKPAQISAKQGFEKYGLRVLRFHPDFVDFVREMEAVPYNAISPNDAFSPLEALARKYKRGNSYWQI
jgi:hypothetical protein